MRAVLQQTCNVNHPFPCTFNQINSLKSLPPLISDLLLTKTIDCELERIAVRIDELRIYFLLRLDVEVLLLIRPWYT